MPIILQKKVPNFDIYKNLLKDQLKKNHSKSKFSQTITLENVTPSFHTCMNLLSEMYQYCYFFTLGFFWGAFFVCVFLFLSLFSAILICSILLILFQGFATSFSDSSMCFAIPLSLNKLS